MKGDFMRKLLLSSSALVAAASISSYALADVSVTGAFEWRYSSISSGVAADDGTEFGTDNEVTITFSNKTDTGLTLTGVYDFDADATILVWHIVDQLDNCSFF